MGHPGIGRRGEMLAAALACGESAVVSHRTAAELHGLRDLASAVFDITTPSQAGRRLDGILWHRPLRLQPSEVTVHEAVPTTTVSRTLVDLAGMLGRHSLAKAVEAAAVRSTLDLEEVNAILGRGRRRGAPQLRQALGPWDLGEAPVLRSALEAELLRRIVEARLPPPRCNARVHLGEEWVEVDLLWERERLVIETDGEKTHRTPAAFQRDRRRDQLLTAAGYRHARVTWQQLAAEPSQVLSRIERMLRT